MTRRLRPELRPSFKRGTGVEPEEAVVAMGYERGHVPPIHKNDRPRLPFSWKAVVLTIIVLAVMAAPFVVMWLTTGFK
jgi:hypothetical protein